MTKLKQKYVYNIEEGSMSVKTLSTGPEYAFTN